MSINLNDVQTYLYDWAVSNLPPNMPAILYYENAPRPTVDYVTLNITNYREIGEDYTPRPSVDSGTVSMSGDREFTLQLQAYGGQPLNTLEMLRYSLQKQTVLDTLRINGIVFVQQFPIIDISELVNSRFEKRAAMDVIFRMGQSYGDTLGSIATVEIEEEFLENNEVVITRMLTVTTEPTP